MNLMSALPIHEHGALPFQTYRRIRQVCALCSVLFAVATLSAAELSGEWEFASKYLGDVSYARVTLKMEDGKLTGSLNELTLKGSVKDDDLTFSAERPNGDHFADF